MPLVQLGETVSVSLLKSVAEVLHRAGGQNDPHSRSLFPLHCSAGLCIIKPQTALLTWGWGSLFNETCHCMF